MAKIGKNFAVLRTAPGILAIAAALALGACASDDAGETAPAETAAADATPAPAPAPAPSAFGAPAPRFSIPSAASQSAPSVNTVPAEAPAPNSTEEEREEARRGLIADLANARHSEFGGRTQPVVVRPYVAAATGQPAPPQAETPPDAPIENRLEEPPPARPADGAPARPAAGPAPANKIPSGS